MPTTYNQSGTPTYDNTTNQYPVWGEELQGRFGNQIAGMLDAYGQLSSNWYNGPLTAGPTSLQQQAYYGAGSMPGQWQGGLAQAGQALGAYSQPYNQAELGQYLNPYRQGVVDEIQRLGDERLRDTMNDVNSTFTVGGGFGGTRNRDAIYDAIQRSQREVLGAQRTALDQAYDTANQNYFQWAGRPLQAASAWGNLANMGANLGWQDVNNQWQLGTGMRGIEQGAYDTAYKDWLTSLQLPQQLMGGLGQLWQQTGGQYWNNPSQSRTNQTMVPQGSGWQDFIALMGGLGQLNGMF